MDKFSELKAAAMAATPGPWGINRTGNTIVSNHSHPVATVSDAFHRQLAGGGVGKDVEFIAAANPAAVLELLAELEATRKQSQELAKQCGRLGARAAIAERKLATPVRLPETYSPDPWMGPDPRGTWLEKEDVKDSIRTAGFKVEEDA